jgi:hypothetical protein
MTTENTIIIATISLIVNIFLAFICYITHHPILLIFNSGVAGYNIRTLRDNL